MGLTVPTKKGAWRMTAMTGTVVDFTEQAYENRMVVYTELENVEVAVGDTIRTQPTARIGNTYFENSNLGWNGFRDAILAVTGDDDITGAIGSRIKFEVTHQVNNKTHKEYTNYAPTEEVGIGVVTPMEELTLDGALAKLDGMTPAEVVGSRSAFGQFGTLFCQKGKLLATHGDRVALGTDGKYHVAS